MCLPEGKKVSCGRPVFPAVLARPGTDGPLRQTAPLHGRGNPRQKTREKEEERKQINGKREREYLLWKY